MKQCPKCYTPNSEASQYCENCGTPLRQGGASDATAMSYQQQTHEPPVQYPVPRPIYTTTPAPPIYAQVQPTLLGRIAYNTEGERKRSGIGIFFGIVLYILGGGIFSFGLASCLVPFQSDVLTGIAFFIGILLSLLALMYILFLHRRPLLRGWIRIILFIILQVPAITALVASFVNSDGPTTTNSQYVALGIVCVIYGICTEVIALI